MKRIFLVMLIALLAVSFVFANGSSEAKSESKVIKLGAVLPVTGSSAESGIACRQGLELAVKEINDAGGVNVKGESYQLQLIVEDDAGLPAQAVTAATKLIELDGVNVVYCSCLSSCALAIMDVCDQYPDVLFTTIECTSDNFKEIIAKNPDRYANFWKPYYNSSDYGATFGEMVADLSKAGKINFANKTVAYIVEDTDAGRTCVTACEASLDKFCGGSTTVAVEVVPQGTTDFYSQINKFKSLNPDIVMTFFVPLNSGVAYIKQVNENNVGWLDIAFVYPLKAGFVEQTGAASEGLLWAPMQVDYWNNPECAAFAEKVYAMFPNAGLNAMHLSAYLGVDMVKVAIEKAGTLKASEGLAEAFGEQEYKSINGTYQFAPDHTAIAGPEYLVVSAAQVQDGKYYVVWPEQFANSEYRAK